MYNSIAMTGSLYILGCNGPFIDRNDIKWVEILFLHIYEELVPSLLKGNPTAMEIKNLKSSKT